MTVRHARSVPASLLPTLPTTLRDELLVEFNKLLNRYRTGDWEPANLNGGKLCEVVYTIVNARLRGVAYPARAAKPGSMKRACEDLEQLPRSTGPHSFRVLIPRMIVALYDVRNNRSVGHTGGEVDPNHMDAAVVVAMAKWLVAELVRVLHEVDVVEATRMVEAITTREVPRVWTTGDVVRVLDPTMGARDQVLILAYAHPEPVTVSDLLRWTEYRNASRFRDSIIADMHRERLIEYHKSSGLVELTPLGVVDVETRLIVEL